MQFSISFSNSLTLTITFFDTFDRKKGKRMHSHFMLKIRVRFSHKSKITKKHTLYCSIEKGKFYTLSQKKIDSLLIQLILIFYHFSFDFFLLSVQKKT